MSNFKMKAVHKKTGETHEIWCLDDYFGPHNYGYSHYVDDRDAMNEKEFYSKYTPIKEQGDGR